MFTIFKNIIERALKKCAPMRTVFIPNDKSDITIQQKWVTEETLKLCKQINSRMNLKDMKYQSLQNDFVEKLSAKFPDMQISSFNSLSKRKD